MAGLPCWVDAQPSLFHSLEFISCIGRLHQHTIMLLQSWDVLSEQLLQYTHHIHCPHQAISQTYPLFDASNMGINRSHVSSLLYPCHGTGITAPSPWDPHHATFQHIWFRFLVASVTMQQHELPHPHQWGMPQQDVTTQSTEHMIVPMLYRGQGNSTIKYLHLTWNIIVIAIHS